MIDLIANLYTTGWLDQAGWSFYSSGALCLAMGVEMNTMLTSSTFALLMPSLQRLVGNDPVPVRLLVHPTNPPEITLAKGDIVDNGDGTVTVVSRALGSWVILPGTSHARIERP